MTHGDRLSGHPSGAVTAESPKVGRRSAAVNHDSGAQQPDRSASSGMSDSSLEHWTLGQVDIAL